MPFLQAVFCFKGFDDRSRFFAISVISLLGFVLLSALFSQYFLISLIILLVMVTALTASTTRRLLDAQLSKNWQLVPGILLLITGLISLNIEASSRYYLLVLPLASIALLLTYPSKSKAAKRKYIFGYFGPVNLSQYLQKSEPTNQHNQRIEPTLIADGVNEPITVHETVTEQSVIVSEFTASASKSTQADIGELIRLKLLNNRKFQIGMLTTIALILLSVFIHNALNSTSSETPEATKEDVDKIGLNNALPVKKVTQRNSPLLMPDDFTLYLSEFNGLIIHWQADQVSDGELWSQLSAAGDKSCQMMSFNKGGSIRPLSVFVENGSDYFATFSPLDSTSLVKAIAFRGKFKLCGYSFSLKGTQAVLGKHSSYAPFLETNG